MAKTFEEFDRTIEKWRRDAVNTNSIPRCDALQECVAEIYPIRIALEAEIATLREHERLAVAAALQKASEQVIIDDAVGHEIYERILTLIPPADRSALDVHDAEVRDRALEEAIKVTDGYGHEGYQLAQEYACETADEIVARIRALKTGGSKCPS